MNSWLLFRVRIGRLGLELSVRNERGTLFRSAERLREEVKSETIGRVLARAGAARRVVVPEAWLSIVSQAFAGVPVFVDPPKGLETLDWEALIGQILSPAGEFPFEVTRWVSPATAVRPAFELPLTVVRVGETQTALGRLARHGWVSEAMKLAGVELAKASYRELRKALGSHQVDLLVCTASGMGQVLDIIRQVPVAQRPRLVLSSSHGVRARQNLAVPAGTAVYELPLSKEGEFETSVDNWVHGMLSSEPLHVLATRQPGRGKLYGGPDTIYANVESGILEQLQSESARVESIGRALELMPSTARKITSIPRRWTPKRAFPAEQLRVVPASRELHKLRETSRSLTAQVPAALSPAEREKLEQAQKRRVDIALRIAGRPGPGETGYLDTETPIEAGGRYLLCVRIGQPFAKSILVSAPPPLDPLLPGQREGHWLHVAIYPKNFAVRGSKVRRLFLPRFGPSRTASFQLKVPADTGTLEARIAIYSRNQQLQSFLFTADGKGSHAKLDFSQTARFRNLDRLGDCAVSIAANHEVSAPTHSLMLYRDRKSYSLRISEAMIQKASDGFRAFLKEATFDEKGERRFDTYPADDAPIRDDFHVLARKAAELGNDLWRDLQKGAPKLDAPDGPLRFLRGCADETIQTVRLSPNFLFPWPLIYDWNLPNSSRGAVCTGALNGAPCGHTATSKVYCINGFWGVRHILEEHIAADGEPADVVTELQAVRRAGAILISADEAADDLAKLRQSISDLSAELSEKDDLLQCLWDKSKRPAIAIIYGHTETGPLGGAEAKPRITLPGRQYLFVRDIDEKTDERFLDDPKPAVFMLGCETALIELATLDDFATAFHRARASVILGTECVAFRSLLARFAREVTEGLCRGDKLGPALRTFRRKLLSAGNPVPFVFHAIGSAGFHLEFV